MIYDVIVLGIGGMGSAAAFELARRGRRVLGLERFGLGHDRGSSHGRTRVIRKAYFEHPDYVPLLHRSYQRWYELEQRRGKHLLTECGCLSLGPADGELVAGVRRAAAEHKLPLENFTAAELRRAYPQFRFDDSVVGAFERVAGYLDVEQCVLSYAEEAQLLGADLRENEPAVSWTANSSGVTVRTERHTYNALKLVVCAGSWSSSLLADLKVPLKPTRQTLFWFDPLDAAALRRDVFPIYLTDTPQGMFYGFPVVDSTGAKVALHAPGEAVTDPSAVNREVKPGEEAGCRAFLERHIPQAAGELKSSKVCLYTYSPDGHFIIDVHPAHSNVCVAAGFSGHGFKFASVVGEILADLADKGRTDLPIDMFRIGRFGGK